MDIEAAIFKSVAPCGKDVPWAHWFLFYKQSLLPAQSVKIKTLLDFPCQIQIVIMMLKWKKLNARVDDAQFFNSTENFIKKSFKMFEKYENALT